jgi:hypothetical protein
VSELFDVRPLSVFVFDVWKHMFGLIGFSRTEAPRTDYDKSRFSFIPRSYQFEFFVWSRLAAECNYPSSG